MSSPAEPVAESKGFGLTTNWLEALSQQSGRPIRFSGPALVRPRTGFATAGGAWTTSWTTLVHRLSCHRDCPCLLGGASSRSARPYWSAIGVRALACSPSTRSSNPTQRRSRHSPESSCGTSSTRRALLRRWRTTSSLRPALMPSRGPAAGSSDWPVAATARRLRTPSRRTILLPSACSACRARDRLRQPAARATRGGDPEPARHHPG